MNICTLLLVHKNVEQVCRLCARLSNSSIYILIHLDKKMRIENADIERIKASALNVLICPQRRSCLIDDWSLVDTTIEMIEFAKHNLPEIEYYVLMSGQDYPIKPVGEFVDFLKTNYPMPYIDCTPYNVNNWIFQKFNHTILMKYARKIKNRYRLRGPVYVVSLLEKILPRCFFTDYAIQQFNIPLYGGSAWWVLPNIIIDEIILFMKNNERFINCYKRSITPEETFFQTLSMCCKSSNQIQVNQNNQISQNCLTYSLFFTENKKFTGHPHIITKEEFSLLRNRPEYFARKFDVNVDYEILNKLDKHVLNIK